MWEEGKGRGEEGGGEVRGQERGERRRGGEEGRRVRRRVNMYSQQLSVVRYMLR